MTTVLDVPVLDRLEPRLDAPPPNRATRRLLRDNLAPRTARQFARNVLAGWGISEDVTETALLLLSELITNSVKHANRGRHVTVTIERGETAVRFTVTDSGRRRAPDVPIDPYCDGDDNGGWGLSLIDALALDHGVYRIPGGNGNSCWFILAATTGGAP